MFNKKKVIVSLFCYCVKFQQPVRDSMTNKIHLKYIIMTKLQLHLIYENCIILQFFIKLLYKNPQVPYYNIDQGKNYNLKKFKLKINNRKEHSFFYFIFNNKGSGTIRDSLNY